MVEEGIDKEVGTIFDIVYPASRWLDEHILRNVSFALPQQHPAVKPFTQIKVRSQLVRFVVVDRQGFLGQFFLGSLLVLYHGLVEGRMGDSFGEDILVEVELFFDVFVLVGLSQIGKKIAFHQRLVFCGDFFGSNAEDAVCVIANSDQQRAQQNTHIEAVAFLPASNVGRRRDAFGELIRRIQLFVLDESAESLCALFVVVQFKEPQFGGSDGGAYEFIDIALIFWVEEQFAFLVEVFVVLFFELDDMFEDELFFWSVFSIGQSRGIFFFELPAPFEFLVDDCFSAFEELQQLVVHFALHFKYNFKYSNNIQFKHH